MPSQACAVPASMTTARQGMGTQCQQRTANYVNRQQYNNPSYHLCTSSPCTTMQLHVLQETTRLRKDVELLSPRYPYQVSRVFPFPMFSNVTLRVVIYIKPLLLYQSLWPHSAVVIRRDLRISPINHQRTPHPLRHLPAPNTLNSQPLFRGPTNRLPGHGT